ncbi:baseplate assembly protein [Pseudaestuariivita sp.]|uniref:baseplate assembly protein n=1 Tax=Pseudaestuariivita sp. TaxID=2211669 RepID=UPI0040596C12
MTAFSAIDLSKLPPPQVVETVSFDVLFDEMKADAIAVMPELAPFLELESEPTTQLLRVCAYRRMLDRLEFNDGARASMLALSTGSDLDQLAAFWGVARQTIQEADDSVIPPIEAVQESDEAFRRRVQLSLEGHSTAGPKGSYLFWALSASGQVRDVNVESPAPGEVLVTILSHKANGEPSAEVIAAVEAQLTHEDVRPLTDLVTVQGVTITTFDVEAVLTLYEGPDEATVLAAAEAALDIYLSDRHLIGHDVTRSGLHAALHQPGVQNVDLISPVADLVVDGSHAAYCAAGSRTVTVGGRGV